MPTYEYACTNCGHQFEIVQSFSDDPLRTCPECQGALRKVFGSVGIVFKGSGFYKTDSRGGSSASKPAETPSSSGSGDAASTSSGDSSSSSSKPTTPKSTPSSSD